MSVEARPLRVGLVQINNSFSGQNYFPYSAGLLQAYAQEHAASPDAYKFLLPLYKRLSVDRAVALLSDADVIGFSVYVWNIRISLAIAQRLKEEKPDRLIVFGGPHVPDRSESFLREHPFIDVVCHGEGERVFLDILERHATRDWAGIPSVSFLGADGAFRTTSRADRLRDMASVPSPYLTGVFDGLMAAHPEEQWLVLWETNRGCPFSCTFCDWGSATASKIFTFDMERLFAELEWIARHNIEFIFCCDANFGILPRDLDIARRAVDMKERFGYPKALSVQNTKNALERAYAVQKMLSDHGLNKGVTISLQSVDGETLKSVKRDNISLSAFQDLQRRFTRDRIETYTDVILGLPGETYDTFATGVSDIIANGQHNRIQFNNLSILPNAEMGDPAYQERYGMVTVETAIVNIHGSLAESQEEIQERQQLVVATASTPPEAWRRTRAFGWWTALLHFDKILQVPLVLLHYARGTSYRTLIELFSERPAGDREAFPILAEIRDFFHAKALDIQQGGVEYVPAPQWLDIFWPADEYVLIKMVAEGKLAAFYAEAEALLAPLWREQQKEGEPAEALHDAVRLNQSLVKQPFQTENLEVDLSSNVWAFYRAALLGDVVELEDAPCRHRVDRTSVVWSSWDDWCREVIWYGNKKGAYLYGNTVVHGEIAGHF